MTKRSSQYLQTSDFYIHVRVKRWTLHHICNLPDQDCILNHKKLLNCMDNVPREMNHLKNVYQMFDFPDHGLENVIVYSKDRQNWTNMTNPKVHLSKQMVLM